MFSARSERLIVLVTALAAIVAFTTTASTATAKSHAHRQHKKQHRHHKRKPIRSRPAGKPAASHKRAFATTARQPAVADQRCGLIGQAGDDLSGSNDGDYSPNVGIATELRATSTNGSVTATFSPQDGVAEVAPLGEHTFVFPTKGYRGTEPYVHPFTFSVPSQRAQVIGFIYSNLCSVQRNLDITQVDGSGRIPASGSGGTLSFKLHLSADPAPTTKTYPNQFRVLVRQEASNCTADLTNPLSQVVEFHRAGSDPRNQTVNFAIPSGWKPGKICFRVSSGSTGGKAITSFLPHDAIIQAEITRADAPTPAPIPANNQAPTASFSYSRGDGAGNPVTLDGRGSRDADGSIASYSWRSGSTELGSGSVLSTKLGAGAGKSVTLTITDDKGAATSATRDLVLPNRAPGVGSVSPAGGVVPSTVPVLSASAGDADGDALSYSFRVTGPSVDRNSGWIGFNRWQVPDHILDPGTQYAWTVIVRDASGATASRAASFTTAMLPTASDVVSTSTGNGYWQIATDGGVFSYGDAQFHGSLPGLGIKVSDVIGMARTPDDGGYWLVGSDGGVYSFGNAAFYGSMGGKPLTRPVVGMAPTKSGHGYWLVGADGGVFAFGDAGFFGSMGGKPLNQPVTSIAPTASGQGYWMAARDGGIFAFGDAPFLGSMGGQALAAPVVDMDATPDGGGYWMTAEDGGVFAFGDAGFYGSLGGKHLGGHITGMSATPTGQGYTLNGCDGGIFAFGDAQFFGSNNVDHCRGT